MDFHRALLVTAFYLETVEAERADRWTASGSGNPIGAGSRLQGEPRGLAGLASTSDIDSGGYMVASAVGFDPVKRRAMVYMAHSCGALCGGGTHHLLEKVDGAWREAKIPGVSNCVWAS